LRKMGRSTILPTTRKGGILKKLRRAYGTSANIQPSFIRLEKVLTANSVAETFTLKRGAKNQNGQRPLENFLSESDVFVATNLGVFIQAVPVDGSGNPLGNNGNQANYPYPDVTAFPAAATATAVAQADCLEAIFNGTLGIKANSYEVVDNMSLLNFRVPPETQKSATTQASLGTLIGAGMPELFVVPVFEGQKKNEIRFEPAGGADFTQIGEGFFEVVMALHFDGFVVRNAAEAATMEGLIKKGVLQ
jgi:hypothetical protein